MSTIWNFLKHFLSSLKSYDPLLALGALGPTLIQVWIFKSRGSLKHVSSRWPELWTWLQNSLSLLSSSGSSCPKNWWPFRCNSSTISRCKSCTSCKFWLRLGSLLQLGNTCWGSCHLVRSNLHKSVTKYSSVSSSRDAFTWDFICRKVGGFTPVLYPKVTWGDNNYCSLSSADACFLFVQILQKGLLLISVPATVSQIWLSFLASRSVIF